MKLSEHFTLEELVYSSIAVRENIDNIPDLEDVARLGKLTQVLEKVRTLLGHPMYITSGYRSVELNKRVKGVENSAHLTGEAADFVCPEFGSVLDVCREIAPHLKEYEIDQLIHEKPKGEWVHIGIKDKPRFMLLTVTPHGTNYGIA